MNDQPWTCPVCGFETLNEQERLQHLSNMEGDPAHISADMGGDMGESQGDSDEIDMGGVGEGSGNTSGDEGS